MSIFPYIYYMVRDFGITKDESKISFYAGMVTSAFTLAEFSTSVLWGRLSDKIGRKPVLLMGLAGTGLSVLTFGFAQSLPVALLARALGGFLNGYRLLLSVLDSEQGADNFKGTLACCKRLLRNWCLTRSTNVSSSLSRRFQL